jgi:hypothetical protein
MNAFSPKSRLTKRHLAKRRLTESSFDQIVNLLNTILPKVHLTEKSHLTDFLFKYLTENKIWINSHLTEMQMPFNRMIFLKNCL